MSKSNTTENNLLKLIFQNAAWTNIGDAGGLLGSAGAGSLYVSLHTADPTDTGDQTTSETAYTNYARVAVARNNTAWTITANTVSNGAVITFPTCGASGATLTHFGVGRASAAAGELLYSGALTAQLIVSNLVTPSFAVGALTITED